MTSSKTSQLSSAYLFSTPSGGETWQYWLECSILKTLSHFRQRLTCFPLLNHISPLCKKHLKRRKKGEGGRKKSDFPTTECTLKISGAKAHKLAHCCLNVYNIIDSVLAAEASIAERRNAAELRSVIHTRSCY